MTVRPLESRLPNDLSSPRAGRAFSRRVFSRVVPLLGLLAFAACTASNEDFFDPSVTSDSLVPLPSATAGAGGGLSNNGDPPPVVPSGGPAGNAGSSGVGSVNMPRPPASGRDAGANPPEQPLADAGVPPVPPSVSDGSCGDQCVRSGGLCSAGTCFFDCSVRGSCNDRQILCPPGIPCDVNCGDEACTDNVL